MLHVPADIPVTNPAAETVATAGLLLLQAPVPPLRTAPFAVKVAVPPIHNGVVPVTEVILEFAITVTASADGVLVPHVFPAVTAIFPFCPVAPVLTVTELVP
jgi:hypothetical protein